MCTGVTLPLWLRLKQRLHTNRDGRCQKNEYSENIIKMDFIANRMHKIHQADLDLDMLESLLRIGVGECCGSAVVSSRVPAAR